METLFFVIPIGYRPDEFMPEFDLSLLSISVPKESVRFVADYLERRLTSTINKEHPEDHYGIRFSPDKEVQLKRIGV
jgi:hypothetical protein